MSDPVRKAMENDVCRWPDGTWCYRSDLDDYRDKAFAFKDNYEIIAHENPEWELIVGLEQTS